MKHFYILLFILSNFHLINAQNVNIPDANFKNALINHSPVIDINGDGEIQTTEAESFVETLDVSQNSIGDLSGIEAFVNLTELICNNNSISTVDLSSNVFLEKLNIAANSLVDLDLTSNINLKEIRCNGNGLSNIDTTSNVQLEVLNASANLISSVDLSQNINLLELELNFNSVSNIDISNNPNLQNFSATYCYSLQGMDFSNNPLLQTISLRNSYINSLDVSQNPDLVLLNILNLNIATLDLSNNPSLFNLLVSDNPIHNLDVSNNPQLQYLTARNINTVNIDVSQNPDLIWLDVGSSYSLQSINAKNGNNENFTYFNASNANYLTSICVDNVSYAQSNFTNIPSSSFFTEICSYEDCPSAQVGYLEEFDNTVQPNIDICWKEIPTIDYSTFYVRTSNPGYSGNNSVAIRTSQYDQEAYLISPLLENFDSDKRISFWLRSNTYNPRLTVGLVTDPNDVTTFVPYRTIESVGINVYEWRKQNIDFQDYIGGDAYVAFKVSGGSARIFIDDIEYTNTPDCTEPIMLESIPYSNEALIDWEDVVTPQSWEIEYGPIGFEQGTGTVVSASNKPFLLQGLQSETQYSFYVRSSCGTDGFSEWSNSQYFTTGCDALVADVVYDFDEGYSGDFYSCWDGNYMGFVQGGNTSSSTYMVELRTNTSNEPKLLTPELFELNNTKRIKFWMSKQDGDSNIVVGTVSNPLDLNSFTPYETIETAIVEENQWTQVIVDFDNYLGTDRYVLFKQESIINGAGVFIDQFEYQNTPSCLEPEGFEVNEITDTSITLQWINDDNALDWELQYGFTEFEIGTGTIINTGSNSTVIENLSPDTSYDVYIRSNCGNGDYSNWFKLYAVRTACGIFSVTYIQDFDVPQMANCWSTIPSVPTGSLNAEEVTVSSTYRVFDSGYSVRFADYTFNDDLYLISPELNDLGSGNNRIKFWLHPRYLDANLVIGTMSDPEDESTFTPYTTILNTDMAYRQWKQFTIDFDSYSGTDNYIAFRMQLTADASNIYEFLYFDQFEYSAIPTCQAPTTLSNDLIANDELTLSWEDSNGATQWEIEYGETGFWQGQGTIVQANSNPFAITGLEVDTVYDFYVRAICDTENVSDWSEKITLDYGCGQSYGVGYQHDFNNNILDACWTAYEFPSNQSSTSFSISSLNNFDDTGYSAYLRDSSRFNSAGVLLVSPTFTDLSADKKIEFYISNYSGGLIVGTMSDPNDYTTFNALQTISGDVTSSVWEKRTTYLANYNGTDQFIAFRFKQVSSSDGDQVYIDDVSYLQSVLCTIPENVTIVATNDTSIEIQWDGSGTELEWEIEYEEVGVYNSEVVIVSATNNFILENLLEGTEYSFRVRAKCDDETLYSDWSDPIIFSTSCQPVEANYFESFEFEDAISPCWTKILETDNNTVNIYAVEEFTTSYNGVDRTVYPLTGNQFIRFANSFDNSQDPPANIALVSREILEIDSNKRVRINLISRQGTSGFDYNRSSFHIGTMSDPNDISTFTLVQTITPEEMNEYKAFETNVVAWKEHTIYFDDYIGTDHYIALKHGDEFRGSEFLLDDFRFEDIPDCTEPLYPVVIDERYDSVDIAWETYENSSPVSWEVEYGLSGFTLGTGAVVTASSEALTIEGLIDDSDYDFYVRANCGSQLSDWSVKQTFKTKCEGFSVVYNESFEGYANRFIDGCWTGLMPQIGDSYWDEIPQIQVYDSDLNYTPDPHTGDKAIRFLNETNHPLSDDISSQTILVSPRLIGLDNYKKISFWMYPISSVYASPTEIIVGTITDPEDYTTFTPYYTITDAPQNEDTWTKYEIDLSNYYLEDEYIAIRQAAINERQVILIDDFEYTESGCVTPTNLEAYQSDTGEITLTWQDNNTQQAPQNWEVEYGPVGFAEGSGTLLQATTNPFLINGLNTFNNYEYRVRAFCNAGDGYSNWSVPYAFTVTCNVQAPFYENFDQYDASYQYALNQPIPNFCWTRLDKQVSGIRTDENMVVSPSSSPNMGFVNFYDSEQSPLPGVMVSPFLSDFDNTKILKIWIRNDYNGSLSNTSGVIIGTMSNPLDRETFMAFTTIEASSVPRYGKEFLIDFSSYTGSDKHIAIMHDQTNDLSLVMFDDIEYKNMPSCLEPINIDFLSVSDTSVNLTWENFGTASNFEVEYGEAGFTQGLGQFVNTSSSQISIGNLNPETSYDFYVRADCGNAETSQWIGPFNKTTACNVESIPWEENFNTMTNYGPTILPNCWQGDDIWVSSNSNISDFQLGDGDTHYLYATYDQIGLEAYLITPMLNLNAGVTYTLRFKIRKEQGDYSFQSVKIWTGMGNTTDALDNYLHYFSDFSFGFYNFHTIETTFTPIVSGDYSFLLDFNFSAPVHTITVDSFSVEGDYEIPVVVSESESTIFDFNNQLPQSLILEETENTSCNVYNDEDETVLLMRGNSDSSLWYDTGNNAQNWIENQNSISKLNFEIDASSVSQLFMSLDLKQAFGTINTESQFRIVVNGIELSSYISGESLEYETIEVNLSSFTGTENLIISLQHLGRGVNDRSYIDNLVLGQESVLGITNSYFDTLKLFPNPAQDYVELTSNLMIDKLTVIDVNGRALQTTNVSNTVYRLDISYFSNGVYFLEIESGNKKAIRKFVKN